VGGKAGWNESHWYGALKSLMNALIRSLKSTCPVTRLHKQVEYKVAGEFSHVGVYNLEGSFLEDL
jgi:hypothetical protein